jgi:alpha-1,3-rhamnosyl/mannosyltransferase
VLHDIAFATRPDAFRRRPLFFKLRAVGYLSARRAAAILTVSDFSRREIARHYRIDSGRLHVIPEAADPVFTPVADSTELAAAIRARYRLPNRYFLAVGSLTPRRYLSELLQGMSGLRRAHPEAALMLVGRNLEFPPGKVEQMVEDSRLGEGLRRADYVPESDLVALYRAAAAAIYLSSYEGFGLPVLEAMASGTPVVTADCASLPEVAGDAALLVDPRRPEAITAALATILEQPAQAAELRRRGLEQAARFSWRRSAQATLEVLTTIARR